MERRLILFVDRWPAGGRTIEGFSRDITLGAEIDGRRPGFIVNCDSVDEDPGERIASAVQRLERAGCRVIRLQDQDMVTLGDIGSRIGRSREIVRLWALGRQGPGGFPPPLNPGADTRLWSWAEVAPWLRGYRRHRDPEEHPGVVAAVGLAIRLRNLLPDVSEADPLRDLFG